MTKLKICAALAGVALYVGMIGTASAFVITAGDYKFTLDAYDNGSLYPTLGLSSVGGADASLANIATLDAVPPSQPFGAFNGSEDSYGILSVASIRNTTTNQIIFNRGTDGFLIGEFGGLTDFFATPIIELDETDTLVVTGQKTYSTGGALTLWKSTDDFDPSLPSNNRAALTSFLSNSGSNEVWLTANFVPGAQAAPPAAGPNATYISQFAFGSGAGSGNGFLEWTGGAAQTAAFDTNWTNTFKPGQTADFAFTITFLEPTPGDIGNGNWLTKGTPDVVGSARVPEPATLALLGMGLIGLVGMRRRKV